MTKRKICVISFDHWNYDRHIVTKLNEKGIDAMHINIGAFRHSSKWQQIKNSFSKIFLGVNPKKKKRQEFILTSLAKIGKQDQILVINPEIIEANYHQEIKKHTDKYIAYLYDSVARCPVDHLLDGIFDEIFSFDTEDVKNYNFKKINNYIYTDKKPITNEKIKFQAFYLASFDKRMVFMNKIAKKLNEIKVSYLFVIVGKKAWIKQLLHFFRNPNKSIRYQRNRIKQENLENYYSKSNVIFDIVRDKQSGLSFRVFEAMAYQKKLITSNPSIINYDFYNPNNILVIDKKNLNFSADFFSSPYIPVPENIYNKYTLEHWTDVVFNLKAIE